MSLVTESPIKAGVNFSKFREGEGIFGFKGASSIHFGGSGSV